MTQSSTDLPKNFLCDRTLWIFTSLLLCLGAVLFFQHLPQALRWPVRLLCLSTVVWLVYLAAQTVRAGPFSGKKLAFSIILGGLFYAALSLICHIFIKLMSPRDDRLTTRVVTTLAEDHRMGIQTMLNGTSYEMFDRDIGWLPRPGFRSNGTFISQQGLRSLREYAIPAPDPGNRILCLGDSFTYGHSVIDTETYPYHGEQIRPGTEWINLGISGACLTQCLLQYRKTGRKFGGKYVVIGFMTDDAKRTVNCFRPFVTRYNPFTKPFAKYSNGTFSIEPNPYQDVSDYKRLLSNERQEIEHLLNIDYLTWSNQAATSNAVLRTAEYIYESMHLEQNIDNLLLRHAPKPPQKPKQVSEVSKGMLDPYGRVIWDPAANQWTKRTGGVDPYGRAIWSPDSLGFIALTRVFDLLYSEIIADGRVPLIVVIPGPLDVDNYTKQYPRLYGTLLDHLKTKGYNYLDFLDPLVSLHKNDLSTDALFEQMHYRGSVNKELAVAIAKALHLP